MTQLLEVNSGITVMRLPLLNDAIPWLTAGAPGSLVPSSVSGDDPISLRRGAETQMRNNIRQALGTQPGPPQAGKK